MINRAVSCVLVSAVLCSVSATPALAASHLWRFNELFSNADGTIQFIEMKECCGQPAETALNNKWVLSLGTGSQFTFPGNINGNTANQHLLLATQSFADLDGAPTPDYIIPERSLPFFLTEGDTLEYWIYPAATWNFGAVPTDGVNSLNRDAVNGDFEAVNSPTNFAGETGSVQLPCPADLDGDGQVNAADLAQLLGAWGPNPGHPADLDGDGIVNASDLAQLLGAWGPC